MTPEQVKQVEKDTARELFILARDDEDQSVRLLADRLAVIIVRDGMEQADGFIKGYWYATGTRNYTAARRVAAVMGLNVRNGDLSA